jgi:hypothetical protein
VVVLDPLVLPDWPLPPPEPEPEPPPVCAIVLALMMSAVIHTAIFVFMSRLQEGEGSAYFSTTGRAKK